MYMSLQVQVLLIENWGLNDIEYVVRVCLLLHLWSGGRVGPGGVKDLLGLDEHHTIIIILYKTPACNIHAGLVCTGRRCELSDSDTGLRHC